MDSALTLIVVFAVIALAAALALWAARWWRLQSRPARVVERDVVEASPGGRVEVIEPPGRRVESVRRVEERREVRDDRP